MNPLSPPSSCIDLGSITLSYPYDPSTRQVGFEIYPTAKRSSLVERRSLLNGLPFIDSIPDAGEVKADEVDSLVQLKFIGGEYSGAFAHGETMLFSPASRGLAYVSQEIQKQPGGIDVITELSSENGLRVTHRAKWISGSGGLKIQVQVTNGGSQPLGMEMLSSFFLGGLSPFTTDDGPGRMRVHRFRSRWSAEGRSDTRTLEELHLERSWSGSGTFSERFGQLGSMPVRKWFPFVALEDVEEGVVWGAQLAWAGSWQMEISRRNDSVCLSGGLADREFGHWMKHLDPGESFEAPMAFVSCVAGTVDDLCYQLLEHQHLILDKEVLPEAEAALPIVVNEWCSSWGDPSHEKVVALADSLKANGSSARYLVIDAGWYKTGVGSWNDGHGDWLPSPVLFPEGLKKTADAIRERGFIPGIWFEMETCGSNSRAFHMLDLLLSRDGLPLTVRSRRFWDLRNPFAHEYLATKVIGLIRECGFGYLKVDYNETIGLGCDGSESQGEGFRQQVLGIYQFFDRIREQLPDLVIENCSSGGHRLEPSMMLGRTAISSSSDAHELPEIPIIAANLQKLILPRQSSIWAVLHAADSMERMTYTLTATFLGRMCLSGELSRLSPEQWNLVRQVESLYAKAAPIIKRGRSEIRQDIGPSWRYPRGRQSVVRLDKTGRSCLIVLHHFETDTGQIPWRVQLPSLIKGTWRLEEAFHLPTFEFDYKEGIITVTKCPDFSGAVFLTHNS